MPARAKTLLWVLERGRHLPGTEAAFLAILSFGSNFEGSYKGLHKSG